MRRAIWVGLAAILLAYSAAHFYSSGIRFPLSTPNLGQVGEETQLLWIHYADGKPVATNNPRQYGPVFLFVMDPLLRWAGRDLGMQSAALYALELTLFVASFALTALTLWPIVPRPRRALTGVLLAALWLNFSPAHAILAVKNVEIWELFLIVLALFCYTRGHRAAAAASIAAAGLIKLLPFAFLYLWLLRDRRTLVYALISVLLILLVSHAIYGSDMGLLYLPHVARSAVGNSWGLTWHENVSIKGMLIKMLGHLEGTLNPLYAGLSHGGYGHTVVIDAKRLAIAQWIGGVWQGVAGLWMTWMILSPPATERGRTRVLFEWSLVSVMLLILSPQTAFEYCTLALGAFSYALARLAAAGRDSRMLSLASYAGAVFLVANVLPRPAVARLLFIEQINRWNLFGQLTPVEGFQYYGFPLLGLILVLVSLCTLPAAPHAAVADVNGSLTDA